MADTAPGQPAADRPMGILDEPNEDRALVVTLDGSVICAPPGATHLVTADDDAVRGRRPATLRRSATTWRSSR